MTYLLPLSFTCVLILIRKVVQFNQNYFCFSFPLFALFFVVSGHTLRRDGLLSPPHRRQLTRPASQEHGPFLCLFSFCVKLNKKNKTWPQTFAKAKRKHDKGKTKTNNFGGERKGTATNVRENKKKYINRINKEKVVNTRK